VAGLSRHPVIFGLAALPVFYFGSLAATITAYFVGWHAK